MGLISNVNIWLVKQKKKKKKSIGYIYIYIYIYKIKEQTSDKGKGSATNRVLQRELAYIRPIKLNTVHRETCWEYWWDWEGPSGSIFD